MLTERHNSDDNLLWLHFAHFVVCLQAPEHPLDHTLAQIFLPNTRCPAIFCIRERTQRTSFIFNDMLHHICILCIQSISISTNVTLFLERTFFPRNFHTIFRIIREKSAAIIIFLLYSEFRHYTMTMYVKNCF